MPPSHNAPPRDPITDANLEVVRGLLTRETLDQLPDAIRDRLSSMANAMEENAYDWPHDKTGRWLGFIQGLLFAHGLLDVNAERDRTRPLFHRAYQEAGLRVPGSIDVDEGSIDS